LLLFISTIIAITFADKLTKPIINLINASEKISKGEFNTKVPEIKSDKEFLILNKNFNQMIEKLKKQQDKLLATERYAAWETVARKLAHEIKNPLTPIQLSIDRLQDKFYLKISEGQEEFKNYLITINRQIKDIENLVNEFSNFARMPRPIFKKINIIDVVERSVDFSKMTSNNKINISTNHKKLIIDGDSDQLYRVFINLIKNSEEAFLDITQKVSQFKGKIDIEIISNNDYIVIRLSDNGTGISDIKKAMTPYYTTKIKGTGLGLPIVSKIINEHSGELIIKNKIDGNGSTITISFPKINE
jgi:two-component system nitrogen regulation sensor histidine kinase NtrY